MTWLPFTLFVSVLAVSGSLWCYFRSRSGIPTLALNTPGQTETERINACESRLDRLEQQRREHQNPNPRSEVLCRHERGDSVAEIASALQVAQGEVKLIIKVQELESGFQSARLQLRRIDTTNFL